MHIIMKRDGRKTQYLSFDERGHHTWSTDRLDAIRFDTNNDAVDCCGHIIGQGGHIKAVDPYDGHYESHMGYEIQVFKVSREGPPRGKVWRYRYAPMEQGRPTFHSPGVKGFTNSEHALKAAREYVMKLEKMKATA